MTPETIEAIRVQIAGLSGRGRWIVAKEYNGDNWAVGAFGNCQCSEPEHTAYVTTDHIHASEYTSDGPCADAEFVARAPVLIFNLLKEIERLMESDTARR